jgi:hypothetical protein
MIGINIWDDFYEDGYIPEGKIQETYLYVEEELCDQDKFLILSHIMLYIETILESKTQRELFFYDSALKYPKLVGTENEYLLFKRWEIRFKNITHQQVDNLVEELNKAEIKYKGEQLEFYSES